ncbi:hypothetical protein F5Y08DRAFT_268108 [Xylaria arbuscula]|nr:hypothetical protein F5Y08DRAFT_268108 [Xylaria arbuscula]
MPKWDDKAERDLLLAMRMAEGGNAVSKENWEKATKIMKALGHTDATVSASRLLFLSLYLPA